MITQLPTIIGSFVGIFLLILFEVIRAKVKKGPMGDFYALYAHKYILVLRIGILLMTVAFIFNSLNIFEQVTVFKFQFKLHNVLMLCAIITFAVSGKIFLQEVERAIRHCEKGKLLCEARMKEAKEKLKACK